MTKPETCPYCGLDPAAAHLFIGIVEVACPALAYGPFPASDRRTDMATRSVTVMLKGIRAAYGGGEYIDLIDPATGEAYDVINVFDYEAGKPRIPMTSMAVMREVRALEPNDSRLHPELYR